MPKEVRAPSSACSSPQVLAGFVSRSLSMSRTEEANLKERARMNGGQAAETTHPARESVRMWLVYPMLKR